jgi:hypothetical protein
VRVGELRRRDDLLVGGAARPAIGDVVRMLPRNSTVSCSTKPIWRRMGCSSKSRTSVPSMSTRPPVTS